MFESVTDPADLEATLAVESLTNPRLRDQVGELSLVPAEDRITGPGTSPIMAAFTHPNPDGSRFSAGDYGVYYASTDRQTAIRETVHHRERLLRLTPNIKEEVLAMRAYIGRIHGDFIDARAFGANDPIYDRDSYQASQAFGVQHRQAKRWGIAYRSVRNAGGECLAVFRPPACSPVRQSAHFHYYYENGAIRQVIEQKDVEFRQ